MSAELILTNARIVTADAVVNGSLALRGDTIAVHPLGALARMRLNNGSRLTPASAVTPICPLRRSPERFFWGRCRPGRGSSSDHR